MEGKKLSYAANRGGVKLTRAWELGSELRAREGEGGGGQNLTFSANPAPMKARISKFLWEVVWLKISIVCHVVSPKLISLRPNKFESKKILNFVENAYLHFFLFSPNV